jgi:predicted DNA binding protein
MMKYLVFDMGDRKSFSNISKTTTQVIEAVVEEMRKQNPICCLSVDVDEQNYVAVASTCVEYVEVKINYGYEVQKGRVILQLLSPTNLQEEIERAVARIVGANHDNRVTESFIDEKKGLAVWILWESLEKGTLGVPGVRGMQERYSLYTKKRGEDTKLIFEDHAYNYLGKRGGRRCQLRDISVKKDTVQVIHDSTPNEEEEKVEKLTFSL